MALIRVRGSAGRYLDTESGETLSRRQYQKRVGKPLPSRPAAPGKMARYTAAVRDYQRLRARDGFTINRNQARTDEVFKRAWRIISSTPPENERTPAQAQALREALQAIGRQPRAWEFYLAGAED